MNFDGLFNFIEKAFTEKKIRFALIGGFALQAAGYARATGDIDFLVDAKDASKAKEALGSLGYRAAYESEDVLNMVNPQFLVGGVDFIKAHRQYALAMLKRARPYKVSEGKVLLAVIPEDLIGLKIQAMSNDPERYARELSDIEWIMKHHWEKMDKGLAEEYFGLFGLKKEMNRILKTIKNAER